MAGRYFRRARRAAPDSQGSSFKGRRRALRCEPLEDRRLLAIVIVDTEIDVVDFNDGKTSLREAVFAANTVPGADEIHFELGHDGPFNILLTQGELKITDSLSIAGPGSHLLTIDASGSNPSPEVIADGSRVFHIDDGDNSTSIEVSIRGMTLTGGDTVSAGGAIRSLESLSIIESRFANNTAYGGAGAIYAEAFGAAHVRLISSQIEDNRSDGAGGGVQLWLRDSSIAEIDGSEFTRNRASGGIASGGGMRAELFGQSELTVSGSVFSQNRTQGNDARGAGADITNSGKGSVTITGSTFLENRTQGTTAHGGGIFVGGRGAVSFIGNRLRGNSTDGNGGDGGGAYLSASNGLRFVGNHFEGNATDATSARGGGAALFLSGSGVHEISRNAFVNNAARGTTAQGGGLHVSDTGLGQVQVASNEFFGNSSAGNSTQGGALAILKSRGDLQVAGNVVERNYAQGTTPSGSGIYVSLGNNGATATVSENRLKQNLAPDLSSQISAGIAIQAGLGSTAAITHNIIEAGSEGIDATSSGTIAIVDNLVTENTRLGVLLAANPQGKIDFSRNAVTKNQGGVNIVAGTDSSVVLKDSLIAENVYRYTGGGVFAALAAGSVVELNNVTVSGNRVEWGGLSINGGGIAVRNRGGSFSLVQSTVSGNSASGAGGGVWIQQESLNGAVPHSVIRHSTITGNTADADNDGSGSGGGVAVSAGEWSVTHSIIAGNVDNSLAAPDLTGGVIDATYSLIGDNRSTELAETWPGTPHYLGNFVGGAERGVIDPRLAPLAVNGIPALPGGVRLLTHALLPGSLAIDGGNVSLTPGVDAPKFDQRGAPFSRVSGVRIDIGALEQTGTPYLVDNFADEFDGDYSRGDLSLREAVWLANQKPGPDVIHFDSDRLGNSAAMIPLELGEIVISQELLIETTPQAPISVFMGRNQKIVTDEYGSIQTDRAFRIDDGDGAVSSPVTIRGIDFASGIGIREGGAIWSAEPLTLEDANFNGNFGERGGAIWTNNELFVKNSGFYSNSSRTGGGAIYATANVTIENSKFKENRSSTGGAIQIHGADAKTSATLVLENSLLHYNLAALGGAVAWDKWTTSVIVGSLLTYNRVQANETTMPRGGALYGEGTAIIAHSTITGNSILFSPSIDPVGEGVDVKSVYLTHSILAFNGHGSQSDIAVWEVGRLSADYSIIGVLGLRRAATANLDGRNNYYNRHLDRDGVFDENFAPGRLAVDAGDPALTPTNSPLTEFDLRGAPMLRISGGRIDIGAIERQQAGTTLVGDFNGDGIVDGADFLAWQRGYGKTNAAVSDGDASGDGDVDGSDLAIWKGRFGETNVISPNEARTQIVTPTVEEIRQPVELASESRLESATSARSGISRDRSIPLTPEVEGGAEHAKAAESLASKHAAFALAGEVRGGAVKAAWRGVERRETWGLAWEAAEVDEAFEDAAEEVVGVGSWAWGSTGR